MPSLSPYRAELDYAYAPGAFPAMECLLHRPDAARRVLLHSKAEGTEAAEKLTDLARRLNIRVEIADKALSRISGKENCFAAAVFGMWCSITRRTAATWAPSCAPPWASGWKTWR